MRPPRHWPALAALAALVLLVLAWTPATPVAPAVALRGVPQMEPAGAFATADGRVLVLFERPLPDTPAPQGCSLGGAFVAADLSGPWGMLCTPPRGAGADTVGVQGAALSVRPAPQQQQQQPLCLCTQDAVTVEWLEAAADAGAGTVFLTAAAPAPVPAQSDSRGRKVQVVPAPGVPARLGEAAAAAHCALAAAARCEWAAVLRATDQLSAIDIAPKLRAPGAARVLVAGAVFADPGGSVTVAERSQYRRPELEPAAAAFHRLPAAVWPVPEAQTASLGPEELVVARYVPGGSPVGGVCDHGPRDLRRGARPRRPQLGVYDYEPNAQCRDCCFNDLRLACGAAKPPQTEGGGKVVLITGLAGFIGMHTALELNRRGDTVVGVDNFNTYYDVHLKRARQARLAEVGITVLERDMCDRQAMACLLAEHGVTHVLNLAAQAGVRYSMQEPLAYTRNNVHCFVSVLESVVAENRARGPGQDKVKVVYASSSSVYGLNTQVPFSETDRVIDQASLYGSTKNANEHIARSYNHVYDVDVTGLRFFTVYGPMGRPDMAYFSFTERLLAGQPLTVYRNKDGSELLRDFTFVSDIVSGIVAAIDLGAHLEVFNLGNGSPQPVSALIEAVEEALAAEGAHITTEIQLKEMMAADVPVTYADVSHARERLGYSPKVSVKEGVREFMRWYAREYNPGAFPSASTA